MIKKLFLALLLTLATTQQIFAIYSLYDLEELNTQLSNNAILCMHQDIHGFIWIGTYDGLNMYDGKTVTTFRYQYNTTNTLLGNIIHNIKDAEDGYLWISTQRGLNKFSLREQQSVESYPELKRVNLITNDKDGNSWMINRDNYVLFYDASTKQMNEIEVKDLIVSDIRSLFMCTDGSVCTLMSDGRMCCLTLEPNINADGVTEYSITVTSELIHNKSINSIFVADQIYILDDSNDLFVYDHKKKLKILLLNLSEQITQYGQISSLQNFNNELYLSFMYSGLLKFDISTVEKTPKLIDMSAGVFGLMKDKSQNAMWVGTDGLGVKLYCAENNSIRNILLSDLPFTTKRPIRSLYTDEENSLWIGTKGDGLMRIKNYDNYKNIPIPNKAVERFANTLENPVYSMYRSKTDSSVLWAGVGENLAYFSYKDNKMHTMEVDTGFSEIHGFCETNDSTLWIASGGLCEVILDKTSHPYRVKECIKYPFLRDSTWMSDEFYALIYDGDSTLYLGSKGGYGIDCFNIYTKKSKSIQLDMAVGDIISMHRMNDSTLFVGTSAGLIQVNSNKQSNPHVKQFTHQDGLINDMIHGILEDNMGIIWLSSNKGLAKYNPLNGELFNLNSRNNKVTEFSDEAYWHCPYTDRLFFGGINGLLWIEPQEESVTTPYMPEFLFTKLNIQGNEQTLYGCGADKGIKLKSYQNTFEISFAILDYINGDNYDFMFMLENYDNTWISLAKDNKIRFTNIPSGEYTLKVKYKSDVLFANNNIYTLPIIVMSPWYLSYWSFAIYVILLIGAILMGLYLARRVFLRKQASLASRLRTEHKEKMYESKLNFISNITHELLTPITLINGTVEQLQKYNIDSEGKRYYEILKDSTTSLHELIQEMLFIRKIEDVKIDVEISRISVSDTFTKLLSGFIVLADRNNITINREVPAGIYWNTYEKGLQMIISNLLTNALKYTPTNGVIDLQVTESEDDLTIVIRNTGKGIASDKLDLIFKRYQILENVDVNANNQLTARNGLGLYICYNMVKLSKGEIQVNSVEGEYTEFKVTLPNLSLTDESSPEEDGATNVATQMDEPDYKVVLENVAVEEMQESSALPSVLIVDDNEDILTLVADILAPYAIIFKANGYKQAMAHLKNKIPNLIITDIMMPEVNGFSFIKILRENKHYKHIPIVTLSAKIDSMDKVKAYELGADAYITKPFSSEILISVVRRFISSAEEKKVFYASTDSVFEFNQGVNLHSKDREFIDEFLKIVKENISESQIGPEFIASKMKISKQTLYRQVKKLTDSSPSELIKHYKFTYAARLLVTTDLSVKEIIYNVGISNKSYFYNEFSKKFQLSPKQYKESQLDKKS